MVIGGVQKRKSISPVVNRKAGEVLLLQESDSKSKRFLVLELVRTQMSEKEEKDRKGKEEEDKGEKEVQEKERENEEAKEKGKKEKKVKELFAEAKTTLGRFSNNCTELNKWIPEKDWPKG